MEEVSTPRSPAAITRSGPEDTPSTVNRGTSHVHGSSLPRKARAALPAPSLCLARALYVWTDGMGPSVGGGWPFAGVHWEPHCRGGGGRWVAGRFVRDWHPVRYPAFFYAWQAPWWFNVWRYSAGVRANGDVPSICRGTVSNTSPTCCPHRPGLFSQVGMLARLWLRSPRSPARIQPFWVLGEKRFVFVFPALLLASHIHPFPLSHASLLATHTALLISGSSPGRFQLASMAWGWLAKGLSRNSVIGVGE